MSAPQPPFNASRDRAAEPRILCRLDDIRDGGSKEIALGNDRDPTLCLVRRGASVFAYHNRCPHTGAPLNWSKDKFLSLDGEMIQCALHGALFRIEDGVCVWGPCLNGKLAPVQIAVRDGNVVLEGQQKTAGPR